MTAKPEVGIQPKPFDPIFDVLGNMMPFMIYGVHYYKADDRVWFVSDNCGMDGYVYWNFEYNGWVWLKNDKGAIQ